MNNIIKRIWNQNKLVQIEDLSGMTFQAESGGHTFQIYGINDAGETVSFSGTPSGVFLRPDNTDVTLSCSVSNGVVSATLPAECYSLPGRGGITVFITENGQKTALYAAVVTVSRTSSGNVAPPATQTVVDLVNAISAAVATIPASYSALMADIAPTYSDSALYSVGQYAWYEGDLKRCISPITTAESFTPAHWASAVLGSDVSDLKSAFNSAVGEFYNATNETTSSTTNLYCSHDISLSPGDKVKVTILDWDQPLSNRASITVYAKASTNYKLGNIPVSTPIPSDTYEYEIPEGTYTGIIVHLKSSSAVLGAKGSVLIEKVNANGSYFENTIEDIIGGVYHAIGETTISTTNLYCEQEIGLSYGDRVRVTVLDWDQEVSNRASITVYAKASTNYTLGTIPINTQFPSYGFVYDIPEGTYTGIIVNLKSSSAVLGAKGSVLIEKLSADGSSLETIVDFTSKKFNQVGFAFAVTGSSSATSRNVYCDKAIQITGGGKIAVKPTYWSTKKRGSIYVFVCVGSERTSLGQIPVPFSDKFYTFNVPDGNYDSVRVGFQNSEVVGVTECSALVIDASDGTLTKFFADSSNTSELNGIKINCLGDSLTYGFVPSESGTSPMSPTWCEQLAADLQCTVRNYGVTGNAVSNNTGGTGNPMCIRYDAMDDDADVVIVMGGTNDFLRVNAPLGTIDSTDNTTFYGAYNVLVQGLIAKYLTRKTRIILMVPPMRNRSDEHNTQGTTIQQIQQAVRDIANKYALPYVDWAYDAGISAYLISQDENHVYTYDGIHIHQDIILGWILPMIERKVIEVIKQ